MSLGSVLVDNNLIRPCIVQDHSHLVHWLYATSVSLLPKVWYLKAFGLYVQCKFPIQFLGSPHSCSTYYHLQLLLLDITRFQYHDLMIRFILISRCKCFYFCLVVEQCLVRRQWWQYYTSIIWRPGLSKVRLVLRLTRLYVTKSRTGARTLISVAALLKNVYPFTINDT